MSIKLSPIQNPKDQFHVLVTFMHGDADSYSSISYIAKNEDDFISMMKAEKDAPTPGASGGDDAKYHEWFEKYFHDELPYDVVYPDCFARVDRVEGFYYDANGVKFEASLA